MTHTPPAYTSHPEFLAFRAAVLANKEDDLPRLVLADWLDEPDRFPLWADLIRVQCELARNPTDGLDRKEHELLQTAELLDQFRTVSRPEFPKWGPDRPDPFFLTSSEQMIREGKHHNNEAAWGLLRRGFVEQIRCPPDWWAEHNLKVRAEWPVTDVWFSRRFVEIAGEGVQIVCPDDLTEFDDRGVKVHLPPATQRLTNEELRRMRDQFNQFANGLERAVSKTSGENR